RLRALLKLGETLLAPPKIQLFTEILAELIGGKRPERRAHEAPGRENHSADVLARQSMENSIILRRSCSSERNPGDRRLDHGVDDDVAPAFFEGGGIIFPGPIDFLADVGAADLIRELADVVGFCAG